MIIFSRTIPFLVGLLVALGLVLLPGWSSGYAWIAIALIAALVFATGSLAGWGRDLERWGHVAITPLGFLVSLLLFLLFLELAWLMILVGLVSALFLFLYFEHLFRFIHLPGTYQPYALEHSSLVLHIASMYFLAVAFYGAQTFLQVPAWMLAVVFAVVSGLLVYETLWVGKLRDTHAVHVAMVGSVVLGEIFLVLSLLPTSFYVNAAAIALMFYMLLGLLRADLLKKLTTLVLRRYVLLGGVLLLVIFLTARWV